MTQRLQCCATTHPGAVRQTNQDAFVSRPELGLFAVADGAGGHQAGELAAGMIRDALDSIPAGLSAPEILAQVRLRIAAVHTALRDEAARRGAHAVVASTIVVLLVRDDHFACLWAGDSRAYLLHDGAFTQITRDHSLVQELVDGGHIAPEEAASHPNANVITRAVGADTAALELDKVVGRLHAGDRLLLCTDGVCKTVPDPEIAAFLAGGEDVCARLTGLLLERHARDNVTLVCVSIPADLNGI